MASIICAPVCGGKYREIEVVFQVASTLKNPGKLSANLSTPEKHLKNPCLAER